MKFSSSFVVLTSLLTTLSLTFVPSTTSFALTTTTASPTFLRTSSSSSLSLSATSTATSTSTPPSKSNYLTPNNIKTLLTSVDNTTPFFVYSKEHLLSQARKSLNFPNAYGLNVRFAMKSSPTRALLQIFKKEGIEIDASSVFEVERAVLAGYRYDQISLSTQELGANFADLVAKGVEMNACSLEQLRLFGKAFKDAAVKPKLGIRINPGVGSGGFSKSTMGFSKTNVGGPTSSFGIWHGDITSGLVNDIVEEYGIFVDRIHTHIGSGSDPEIWKSVAVKSLSFALMFPTVTTLNLGGGFKVGRMPTDKSTNLEEVGASVKSAFIEFKEKTGREIKLEIEPGTFLVANAGALVARVQDKVTTSDYTFLKLDAGMTEVLRPSLYGALHPIIVLPSSCNNDDVGKDTEEVVVVGHCCESGDLLTPLEGQPESIGTRVVRKAEIGDFCVIDAVGAYCSSMNTKNYNAFPEAAEIIWSEVEEKATVVRKRQTLKQMFENENEYHA